MYTTTSNCHLSLKMTLARVVKTLVMTSNSLISKIILLPRGLGFPSCNVIVVAIAVITIIFLVPATVIQASRVFSFLCGAQRISGQKVSTKS